jgi:hypothetical protein
MDVGTGEDWRDQIQYKRHKIASIRGDESSGLGLSRFKASELNVDLGGS